MAKKKVLTEGGAEAPKAKRTTETPQEKAARWHAKAAAMETTARAKLDEQKAKLEGRLAKVNAALAALGEPGA